MFNKFIVYLQYILPQHLLTIFIGWLAQIRVPFFKNWMIARFVKKYQVDMTLARIEDPKAYPNFNEFFTRQLKPHLRPITAGAQEIVSPVDGIIAQIGKVNRNSLLQVKNFYFDLETLLGGDKELASIFYNGSFVTLYLSPRDCHRIYMPLSGKLIKSSYVPGKLFSVNRIASELIPNLYSRNERFITIFETAAGLMAVILVGAIIVGSIQTVWMNQPIRHSSTSIPKDLFLKTGDDLGLFKLGSTVIILFEKNKVKWNLSYHPDTIVNYGQTIGQFV